MRIELAEACECETPRPGYVKFGHRICTICQLYILKRSRMKRLRKVARLKSGNEFATKRTRAKGGLPVNGTPTSKRSQRG